MEIQSILNNAVVQAEQEAVATTNKTRLIDVFRENYDDWNGRLFPAWKKVGKVCHQELALLLNQVGFSTVNPAMVSRYMKLVRDERKKNRSSVTVTQSAKTTVKNHSVSAPELVTVGATGSEDRDCLDPSWLGDEPNWTELVKPGARRPKIVEDWDSYWENVWRWLYSLADAHGLNSFDRTVYAGFKKISASIGDLWLDLSKVRRLMNSAGVLLDPKGIGKARA